MKLRSSLIVTATLLALTHSSFAGGKAVLEEPMDMATTSEVGSSISGSLSLDYNTHFISYGNDVWANGGSTFGDSIWNPAAELVWDLGSFPVGNLSFILGTWWDVNNNANSNIGKDIQEVDVWGGFNLNSGIFDFTLLYQEWYYGSDTEHILDFIIAADVTFAPSLTFHGRLDAGASGGDEGLIGVLGADLLAFGDGVSVGPIALSVPVSVAYGSSFHPGGGSGYQYTSAGLQASYPLEFIDSKFGEWSLNFGTTYYDTSSSNIPTNATDEFWTANSGISISF